MLHFRFARQCPAAVLLFVSFAFFAGGAQAQVVPSPKAVLGFQPTDDRTIADWRQINDYFQKLDAASDRVRVQQIGTTTLGRPLVVAFISAPENIRNLERIKQTNQRLADPRTIKSEAEAESLVRQGKTTVVISCSIHSTEIVASQMSMNLAYELATARSPETLEILQNTVLLLIPSSNPDGVDIVANWYRKNVNTKFEGSSPPELYHHYAGHDNNRDWFMLNLKETQAITRFFWQEWFPQIVYDVHQQGQTSSRFTIPPFFDPPNPRVAPLILREIGLIGYKMAADLQAANVAGVATNSAYDTWWHGGFRSAPYFHNSLGILSEAASANLMSPANITAEDLRRNRGTRGLPSPLETATNHPEAWRGGAWRPRDIANMEMIASRALLELAAKFRPRYLRNFYELGKANLAPPRAGEPQAYVITAGQPNAETVSRLLEILLAQGMEVHQMTHELYLAMEEAKPAEFHEMPLGSFIVFVNQPQKMNVLSLFERQVYPNRVNPATGEAEVPYDVAGWTLPLQMNVQSDAVWAIQDFERYRGTLKKLNNVNEARQTLNLRPQTAPFAKLPNPLRTSPRVGLYKGFAASMDEGWTRLVFDNHQVPYRSVSDEDLRGGNLPYDTIVLPAQPEREIVEGLRRENYPEQYTGGVTEKGVENLRKFVEAGGRLVCFDDGCEMVINRFKLPMKSVLVGLKRSEFYNPGSVVRLEVETRHPLARGLTKDTPAYFINSAAYDIADASKIETVARYASREALLSGWMLGEKYLNGKTALARASYGRGSIVLFGFRPQHRGQTYGTFPFVFNALEK